jgi:hypothetical protein
MARQGTANPRGNPIPVRARIHAPINSRCALASKAVSKTVALIGLISSNLITCATLDMAFTAKECDIKKVLGSVAQLVEHWIENPGVSSSNLLLPTK